MNTIRFGILTISDRSARSMRPDASGPALADLILKQSWVVVKKAVLPDEISAITDTLIQWVEGGECDVILTTGGTGFAARDVTPEATRLVIQREAPGLAEAMRSASLMKTQHAMLSRAIAGIRGQTLIINLPGSPKGALDNLQTILPVLFHASQLLHDDPDSEKTH